MIHGLKNSFKYTPTHMVRCWVNQPSTLQPYHRYHGQNVLARLVDDRTCLVYFLSGDVVAQEMDSLALSEGWR